MTLDISIAMCTYNGEKFIGEQLTSLREQTKLPLEVVICDDASTDRTAQIVEEFAACVPFPVVFVRNPVTQGSTRNFDQAVRLCRGQAIALCDQDDLWQANKLARVDQILESEPDAGAVFSNAYLVNEKSEMLPQSLWTRRKFTRPLQLSFHRNGAAELLKYNAATGATLIFRSQFVKLVTPIPEEWVHDAWIALLIATQSRVRLLPEKLISYRIHSAQQIGVKATGRARQKTRSVLADQLLIKRWSVLDAKITTLPVDAEIGRLVAKRLSFLRTRTALQQEHLAGRVIAASRTLPGYFRFARGFFSYVRDIAGRSCPAIVDQTPLENT